MATVKQKKAFDIAVENGGNMSRAMREAGYSPATAKTPDKLTKSDGYKELMEEYGLTEGLIARALVNDIKKKPKNRVAELKLASEILGMKAVQGTGENKTLIINITGETAQRYGLTASNPETSSD